MNYPGFKTEGWWLWKTKYYYIAPDLRIYLHKKWDGNSNNSEYIIQRKYETWENTGNTYHISHSKFEDALYQLQIQDNNSVRKRIQKQGPPAWYDYSIIKELK